MKVKKLLHTRYRVNDIERTVKFYREILGLEEVRRHKSPRGSELAFLKAPESDETVEICFFPSSGLVQVQSNRDHFHRSRVAVEQFQTLLEAKIMAEDYRQVYNQYRPHSSLGYLTPDEFMLNWQSNNPGLSQTLAH